MNNKATTSSYFISNMSGLKVPGLIIGVVPLVLKATIEAWKILDDTISFSDDNEDLAIRLETLKAHLGVWAMRVGLNEGGLLPALVPFEELIEQTLKRICDLITSIKLQRKKYGLMPAEEDSSKRKWTNTTIIQMRLSLHGALSGGRAGKMNIAARIQADAKTTKWAQKDEPGLLKKVSWAIHDKQKFQGLVNAVKKHVSSLQNFLIEHEQRQLQQEGTRITLDIIKSLSESGALTKLRGASVQNNQFSQMDISTLAKWKAITVASPSPPVAHSNITRDWSLASITTDDRSQVQFIKRGQVDNKTAYLFKKKDYNPNIGDDGKDKLQDRMHQLMTLLGDPESKRYPNTFQALGYFDDPSYHCWWIVFSFLLGALDTLDQRSNQPLSLQDLYSSPHKPALESRYKLAKHLIDSFARLDGSDWCHKGINSKNIINPETLSANTVRSFKLIQNACVQGFNYSRQLTQAQTIDRGKVLKDLEAAIYCYPLYQGDAPSGYQIHYDIYSLGLVLFGIALWGPLMDILAAKFQPGKEPPVSLSPTIKHFHKAEAFELKRRVLIRLEYEMAYCVGTQYKEVVKWCLSLQGSVTALDFYNTVAIY